MLLLSPDSHITILTKFCQLLLKNVSGFAFSPIPTLFNLLICSLLFSSSSIFLVHLSRLILLKYCFHMSLQKLSTVPYSSFKIKFCFSLKPLSIWHPYFPLFSTIPLILDKSFSLISWIHKSPFPPPYLWLFPSAPLIPQSFP